MTEEQKKKEDRMEEAELRAMKIRANARVAGRIALEKLEKAQEKHGRQKGGDGDSE